MPALQMSQFSQQALASPPLVLDQVLIEFLRGSLQLGRNLLFAVAKLAILFMVGIELSYATGITIYDTWTAGSALSLSAVVGYAVFKSKSAGRDYLPQWSLLRKLGPAALQHHFLNLTLQAPNLTLPVLVTVLLSAKMNAWFYVSWMIASFVFTVPVALTTVLHAMNSAQRTTVLHKVRLTVGLGLVASLAANCLLQFDMQQVLGLFGSGYAEQAAWTLRFLALAAFPLTIIYPYVVFKTVWQEPCLPWSQVACSN